MPNWDKKRIPSDDQDTLEELQSKGWEVYATHTGEIRLRRPAGYVEEDAEEEAEEGTEEARIPEPTSAARKLAFNEGVDLVDVDGTGRNGRITKSDVERHLEA